MCQCKNLLRPCFQCEVLDSLDVKQRSASSTYPCCECCPKGHGKRHYSPCEIHQKKEFDFFQKSKDRNRNYVPRKKAKKYPVPQLSAKLAEASGKSEDTIERISREIFKAIA